MVETFEKSMNKSQVVQSPRDEILKGVIIKIEKGLLSEFLDPAVHAKFDNLEQPTLRLSFEVKYNDKIIKGQDRLNYYEEPMSNSKLGKFLTKYDKLEVGQEIKVIYNDNGFGSIKVD